MLNSMFSSRYRSGSLCITATISLAQGIHVHGARRGRDSKGIPFMNWRDLEHHSIRRAGDKEGVERRML